MPKSVYECLWSSHRVHRPSSTLGYPKPVTSCAESLGLCRGNIVEPGIDAGVVFGALDDHPAVAPTAAAFLGLRSTTFLPPARSWTIVDSQELPPTTSPLAIRVPISPVVNQYLRMFGFHRDELGFHLLKLIVAEIVGVLEPEIARRGVDSLDIVPHAKLARIL